MDQTEFCGPPQRDDVVRIADEYGEVHEGVFLGMSEYTLVGGEYNEDLEFIVLDVEGKIVLLYAFDYVLNRIEVIGRGQHADHQG